MKPAIRLTGAFLVCLLLCGCLPVWYPAEVPTDAPAQPTTVPEPVTAAPTIPPATAALPTTEPETLPPEPLDGDFVRVLDYIPDLVLDLKYATEDNFTGQVIYDFSEAWLRYGTVKKLIQVQRLLGERGLYLKIWDAYRPMEAQFRLWEICPDPTYVSDPNNGSNSHARGNTVDITLVDVQGNEVKMPTGFDDFSALADRDYSDCDPEAAENALLLENLMKEMGFRAYFGEWWHFTDSVSYDIEQTFIP